MEDILAIICGVLIIMAGQLWHIHREQALRNKLLLGALKLEKLQKKVHNDQTDTKPD